MSNSIAPGSSANVNVSVTALTTNPNVPVTYKTIILKKNLVNGVNTLTQEMMSVTNIKYVIKYDYVLGEDVTVPADCILEFDGGSISASGGNDTITGANTGISAGIVKIFNTDITLAGTWNVVEVYPEWFGAEGDGVTDDKVAFVKAFTSTSILSSKITLRETTYFVTSTITIPYTTIIEGNGATLVSNTKFNNTANPLFDILNPLTIRDIIATNTADGDEDSGCIFCECHSKKIIAENCVVTGFCTAFGSVGDNSVIKDNDITLSVVKDTSLNAFYGIHGDFSNGYICNNTIRNGRHCIYLSGETDSVTVDSNICYASLSSWQPIHLYNPFTERNKLNNIIITNNKVYSPDDFEHQGIIAAGMIGKVIFSNNYIKANKGIKLEGISGFSSEIKICNNNFHTISHALEIQRIDGCVIENNDIPINAPEKLIIYDGSKNIFIKNNSFNYIDGNIVDWIRLTYNIGTQIVVTGNVINNFPEELFSWQATGNMYGISIEPLNTPNFSYVNNILCNEHFIFSANAAYYKHTDNKYYYSFIKTCYLRNNDDAIPSTIYNNGDTVLFSNDLSFYGKVSISGGTTTPNFRYIHITVQNTGTTANRPNGIGAVGGILNPNTDIGFCYFDTDLDKPIYVSAIDDHGSVTWVDATGTTV